MKNMYLTYHRINMLKIFYEWLLSSFSNEDAILKQANVTYGGRGMSYYSYYLPQAHTNYRITGTRNEPHFFVVMYCATPREVK